MRPEGLVFDRNWRIACQVVPASKGEVDSMIRAHYIGKWPGVSVLILALKHRESLVGVVVYALPPRETSKRYGGNTWELARLWIHDEIPANAETFLISQSVKYIRRNRQDVKRLVSYADPSAGHSGTIYRAANWKSDGRTDQERKSPRCDYADAITGKKYSRRCHIPEGVQTKRIPRISKYRFVYFLDGNKPV